MRHDDNLGLQVKEDGKNGKRQRNNLSSLYIFSIAKSNKIKQIIEQWPQNI